MRSFHIHPVDISVGTAPGAGNIGANGAIAVGGYLAIAGLWAAPISGASLTPVRSFAPDFLRGDLTTARIYVVGPVLGAMVAVLFEWILTNPANSERNLGGARRLAERQRVAGGRLTEPGSAVRF